MKTEVSTAANFVTRLLRGTRLLSEEQLQKFRFSLEESLGGKKELDVNFLLFRSKFNQIMVHILWFMMKLNIVLNKADEGLLQQQIPFTEIWSILWLNKAPESLAKNCEHQGHD